MPPHHTSVSRDTTLPPRKQADRAREMRDKLVSATVIALDAHGFAATSISVVQQQAGVSRGALMHHFATRNDLIVATARHLLNAALRPTKKAQHRSKDIGELLQYYWRRVVNTREGRAFIEILIACRTDPDLKTALGSLFIDWEAEISAAAMDSFEATSGRPEDVAVFWSIARSFLRGLIVHGQFTEDPEHLEKMIARFSELMSSALRLKPQDPLKGY